MVEAYPIVGALSIGARRSTPGPRRQTDQRHAHMGRPGATRITNSIRPRILRQCHQAICALSRHKLSLHVVLPSRVRLHSHVNILSCYYSWSRLLEKPRLDVTPHSKYRRVFKRLYTIPIIEPYTAVNLNHSPLGYQA